MPTATYELPYDGAKEMLLVEDVEAKNICLGFLMQCTLNCQFLSKKEVDRFQPIGINNVNRINGYKTD